MRVLALHGAGRDETDLRDFTRRALPGLAALTPRGAVAQGAGFTFFARRADRSIDAPAVLALARAWLARYGLDHNARSEGAADRDGSAGDVLAADRLPGDGSTGVGLPGDGSPPCPEDGPLLLAGYSSGAIFAEALLAVAPGRFRGAVLMRPEPLAAEMAFPDLSSLPVLLLAGLRDDRRRPGDAPRLAAQLAAAGARVEAPRLDCGHDWAPDDADVHLARDWAGRHGLLPPAPAPDPSAG
ncbi:hypothetical protein V8J36_16230 [Frigidibacter sp. MR17.14]|uniref:alpha/beta hydrolase n=1 Tax=Frigidibacter sp. MR17.14 TaxID=3126509 RepID=UPI003012A7FF